jgi:hypothetical protein|tara:strand:+ start:205 stop:525 length:321 start_codon:yes stop_codon:yes gene_type:complete
MVEMPNLREVNVYVFTETSKKYGCRCVIRGGNIHSGVSGRFDNSFRSFISSAECKGLRPKYTFEVCPRGFNNETLSGDHEDPTDAERDLFLEKLFSDVEAYGLQRL